MLAIRKILTGRVAAKRLRTRAKQAQEAQAQEAQAQEAQAQEAQAQEARGAAGGRAGANSNVAASARMFEPFPPVGANGVCHVAVMSESGTFAPCWGGMGSGALAIGPKLPRPSSTLPMREWPASAESGRSFGYNELRSERC
jgi:hypothetical protein